MTGRLRTRLFNALAQEYLQLWANPDGILFVDDKKDYIFRSIWDKFLALRTSDYSFADFPENLESRFFGIEWSEVYDLLEFVADHDPSESNAQYFRRWINEILEEENSGYRFVGAVVAPLVSDEALDEIERAVDNPEQAVRTHIDQALRLLSRRDKPDYRNSIKEAISAVEATCKLVSGQKSATLGAALKAIPAERTLHPALKDALLKLYGYACDEQGIRHALMDESRLGKEDAIFMLTICAAFVNFLQTKAQLMDAPRSET